MVEESTRLDTLHGAALEDVVDAKLALGQHRRLIAELRAAIAAHPFRVG